MEKYFHILTRTKMMIDVPTYIGVYILAEFEKKQIFVFWDLGGTELGLAIFQPILPMAREEIFVFLLSRSPSDYDVRCFLHEKTG